MSDINTYNPYVGSGQVYLKREGGTDGRIAVGNVANLKPSVSETEKKQNNYTKPGGGKYASLKRIDSVSVSLDLLDMTPKNLAIALFGEAATVAAGTVASETKPAYADGLITTDHLNPTSLVVKSADGNTTYTLGTDYKLSDLTGMPVVIEGGAISTAAAAAAGKTVNVKLAYEYAAYEKVEALVEGAAVYELVFEGVNEANGNKAMVSTIHRVNFGPLKELLYIGDEFSSMTITGECLPDTSKAIGLSQYMNNKMEQ